jgi:hypothetical protein
MDAEMRIRLSPWMKLDWKEESCGGSASLQQQRANSFDAPGIAQA